MTFHILPIRNPAGRISVKRAGRVYTGKPGSLWAKQTSFIPWQVIYKRVEINIDDDPTNVPGTLLDLVDRICLEGDRLLEETGDDEDYPIEGYVVEWTIRGRGAIHNQLMEQEQESMEFLLNSLREQYEGSSPFYGRIP